MKKTFLLPVLALALLATSCTSTTHEESTTTTDSTMMPATPGGMESTPSTDANGMAPADNTSGGISTGTSEAASTHDGSMGNGNVDNANGRNSAPGTNTGAGSGNMNGSRNGSSGQMSNGGGGTGGSQNNSTNNPKSTYPKTQPGAPVDGRMPEGTSR